MSGSAGLRTIFLDISSYDQTLVDSSGNPVTGGGQHVLYRSTSRIVHRVTLFSAGNTPYSAPVGASWYFGMDNTRQGADPTVGDDPVSTMDSDFNQVADWSEVDPTVGKIVFPVNTATDELAAKFTSAIDELDMYGELWMQDADADPDEGWGPLVQWPIKVRNTYSNQGSASPLSQSLGQLLIKLEDGKTTIFNADGSPWQQEQ